VNRLVTVTSICGCDAGSTVASVNIVFSCGVCRIYIICCRCTYVARVLWLRLRTYVLTAVHMLCRFVFELEEE